MGVPSAKVLGRYALFDEIASGGMATVHIGRLVGEVGFSRTVAIKRLHPQLAKDPEFVSMLVDEARLAARIRHPNVVPTLDAVKTEQELFLVMEYVHGESFHYLLKQARRAGTIVPARYAVPIVAGVLHGLHAAHEAKGEGGQPLEIVHRDVSPQNILVGTDGVPRVFDFGIAKACGRLQVTRQGQLKGKLPYMAPEQLSGGAVGRRVDIYATAVVLWEALAGRRLFNGKYEAELLAKVIAGPDQPPSAFVPDVPKELDDLVMCGLARNPTDRFVNARDMARALEHVIPCASPTEIGEWVEQQASDVLALRAARIDEIESRPSTVIDVPEKPQKTLGSYELIGELHKSYLGSGWAGRAVEGRNLGSIVLIRRIYCQSDPGREGAAPKAVGQLAAAARATIPLRHVRLIPVLEVLETGDELAVVSHYLEGETLRSLLWLAGIRRTPIPPPVALRIMLDLLEGLDFLHGQRLADPAASSCVGLTADDVLVGTDGCARIMEPGVAGVAATLDPWSRHPKRACYDPPERLREGVQVDLRADLFTAGVLLWEMLQNRSLFTGSNLSEVSEGILSGIIERIDTSPSVPGVGMSDALGNVVARALERDETARYQSAPEMVAAIHNAGEAPAPPAAVAQLVEKLAVSSLMMQRHQIVGKPSGNDDPLDTTTVPDTPLRPAGGISSGQAFMGAAPLPHPAPPSSLTDHAVTQPSGAAPHLAAEAGPPLRASASGGGHSGPASAAAAPLSVSAEAMPTTVLDPDGPTLEEDPSTGVRRVGAAPGPPPLRPAAGTAPTLPSATGPSLAGAAQSAGPASQALPAAPTAPADASAGPASQRVNQISGSFPGALGFDGSDTGAGNLTGLPLLDHPPKPARSRVWLVALAILFCAVVVAAIRLLTLGGGTAESAPAPSATGPTDALGRPGDPDDDGTAADSDDPDDPPDPDDTTDPDDDPDDPATAEPSAAPPPKIRRPPKEKRYYPKGI
ncbi:MAG: protein kinase [Deltaproteobacteria bacterium]|nr:protein kinase [Deltaproteobacteria bacterium]